MSEAITSSRRAATKQRRQRAVELRVEGATFDQIGSELGCTRSAAWKMVRKTLDEIVADTRDAAAELRALELARIDQAWAAIWPLVERGNLRAVDRAVRLSDLRCRLLGLYSPTRIAPTDPSGTTEFTGGGLCALLVSVRESIPAE